MVINTKGKSKVIDFPNKVLVIKLIGSIWGSRLTMLKQNFSKTGALKQVLKALIIVVLITNNEKKLFIRCGQF